MRRRSRLLTTGPSGAAAVGGVAAAAGGGSTGGGATGGEPAEHLSALAQLRIDPLQIALQCRVVVVIVVVIVLRRRVAHNLCGSWVDEWLTVARRACEST